MRVACLLIASADFRRGAFLSRVSPLYETKMVGIQRTLSRRKAGEVQSQYVYPRASKVARKPPLGKEEASPSPLIRDFPLNLEIG